jgi:hypothetical protein
MFSLSLTPFSTMTAGQLVRLGESVIAYHETGRESRLSALGRYLARSFLLIRSSAMRIEC